VTSPAERGDIGQELRVEPDGAVGAGGEDPGLGGVEEDVEDAQVQRHRVALQHLHGHQQRVLEQVAVVETDRSARGFGSLPPPSPGDPRVTPEALPKRTPRGFPTATYL